MTMPTRRTPQGAHQDAAALGDVLDPYYQEKAWNVPAILLEHGADVNAGGNAASASPQLREKDSPSMMVVAEGRTSASTRSTAIGKRPFLSERPPVARALPRFGSGVAILPYESGSVA